MNKPPVSSRAALFVAAVAAGALATITCRGTGVLLPAISTPRNQELEPIPDPELNAFGCDDPFVVCVNTCTARLVHPEIAPLVSEDQQVAIRTVGWARCKPKHVSVSIHNVSNINVGYRSPPSTPPPTKTDGGAGEAAVEHAVSTLRASASIPDPGRNGASLPRDGQPPLEGLGAPGDPGRVLPLLNALQPPKGGRVASSDCKVPATKAQEFVQRIRDALKTASEALASVPAPLETIIQTDIEELKEALDKYAAAVARASADCRSVGPSELLSLAKGATAALDKLTADLERAARRKAYDAAGKELASFGDWVITIPKDISIRQLIVDVQFTPTDPSDGETAQGPDAGVDGGALLTHNALVFIQIDHGRYYYDVGVLTAFVPGGQRTVSAIARPGIPGDQEIVSSETCATLTGITVNGYPFGRRRQSYSPFEGRPPLHVGLADLLGLQLAFNPDLKNATATVFGGLVVEPLTGLSANIGVVRLQGDFLQSGYAVGMSAPANRSDFVATKPMWRFYFGFTLSYEFIHTTTARLPPLNSGSSN